MNQTMNQTDNRPLFRIPVFDTKTQECKLLLTRNLHQALRHMQKEEMQYLSGTGIFTRSSNMLAFPVSTPATTNNITEERN